MRPIFILRRSLGMFSLFRGLVLDMSVLDEIIQVRGNIYN